MNPESYSEFIEEINNIVPFLTKTNIYSNIKNVPLEFLLLFVDDAKLKTIYTHEKDYINNLIVDIDQNGLKNPIELKSDLEGKICVTEGHHRIIACKMLEFKNIPTVLKPSKHRITGYGRNISLYPKEIWKAIGN